MILETLEKRLAPASLVSVVLSGGALKITGDAGDNVVYVEEVSEGLFRISGSEGTDIFFDGATGSSFEVPEVTKGLTIDLKEGGDALTLGGISVAGALSIALGGGDNTLTLTGAISTTGDLTVTALKGNDEVISAGQGLQVGGKTSFNLGDGDNAVRLDNMGFLFLTKGLAYTGGSGGDDLVVEALGVFIYGPVDFKMGAGGGLAQIRGDALNIQGGVSFTSLAHESNASTFNLAGVTVNISGSVTVKQGNGSSLFDLYASDVVAIGGSVSVSNGTSAGGDGSMSTLTSAGAVLVGGHVAFSTGGGASSSKVEASVVEIGGKVSISNGAGSGSTEIGGGRVEIGDSLTITNKAGLFQNTISADQLDVMNAITITNAGATAGSGNTIMTNAVKAASAFHAGSISITNGVGLYANTIALNEAESEVPPFTTGVVTKGITIKNGHAVTVSAGREGAVVTGTATGTTTLLQGDFEIGGNVAITNGDGFFINKIGMNGEIDDLYIGGSLAITNGKAGGLGISNFFDAQTLTVGKGVVIKNGASAAGGSNLFEVEALKVSGAFSLTNGDNLNGALSNVFDLGRGSFGSVVIKNGNGAVSNTVDADTVMIEGAVSFSGGTGSSTANHLNGNVMEIGGAVTFTTKGGDTTNDIHGEYVKLGGGLTLTHGSGKDEISLGGEECALYVNGGVTAKLGEGQTVTQIGDVGASVVITGAVNVTALGGNDELYVTGVGRIGSGVNASFGAGAESTLSLQGNNLSDNRQLTVGGGINLTAGVNSQVDVKLIDGSFGALTLNGNGADDRVEITSAVMRGAVKLDLKGGADAVTIDDSTFMSSVSILTGDGEDLLVIEGKAGLTPAVLTRFLAAVNVNLGADDDTLRLHSGGGENGINFYAPVTLNGGAGENVRSEGSGVTYWAGDPVLLGF